jgi:tRNA-binding EMAP/Myf-like protein
MPSFENFLKLEIRVGTVREARRNEKAIKPAYVLTIDFGPAGLKQSSAQITTHYRPADLIGRQVAAVTNFPPEMFYNGIGRRAKEPHDRTNRHPKTNRRRL